MLQIGKNKTHINFKEILKLKKLAAFSLIEIIVSLAIFSFIISIVIGISISLVKAEERIQAQLFLYQTAQTIAENISVQLRYGYYYTGATQASYTGSASGETITINQNNLSAVSGSSATETQVLVNAQNSPIIVFESQDGNPTTPSDQNAFCTYNGKLYKLSSFHVQTDGVTYYSKCDEGESMLPDDVIIDSLTFDVYNGNLATSKNPLVRLKMQLHSTDGGVVQTQTSVSQRLVRYF